MGAVGVKLHNRVGITLQPEWKVGKPAGSDLIRVKCHIISHHFMDDPDQLSGVVSEGCVVVASFRTFFIV